MVFEDGIINITASNSTLYPNTTIPVQIHLILFSVLVLCTIWTIGANLVILGCFIYNRKQQWSSFSRQTCSMSPADLLVGLTSMLNLVMELTGRYTNGIFCSISWYSLFVFQSVTLYHVLGICIFRFIKLKLVSEPINDARYKFHSYMIILASWVTAFTVEFFAFIRWSKASNQMMTCRLVDLFGSDLQNAMTYIASAHFVPQCLTNIIYFCTCYRYRRAVGKVAPAQTNVTSFPLSSTPRQCRPSIAEGNYGTADAKQGSTSAIGNRPVLADGVGEEMGLQDMAKPCVGSHEKHIAYEIPGNKATKNTEGNIGKQRSRTRLIEVKPIETIKVPDRKQTLIHTIRNNAAGYTFEKEPGGGNGNTGPGNCTNILGIRSPITAIENERTGNVARSSSKQVTTTTIGTNQITPAASRVTHGRQPTASSIASQRRIIGTIGILLLLFNIFTLPFTLSVFIEPSQLLPQDAKGIAISLFIVNSGLNAIVYACRAPSLRKDVMTLFRKCSGIFCRND